MLARSFFPNCISITLVKSTINIINNNVKLCNPYFSDPKGGNTYYKTLYKRKIKTPHKPKTIND